MATFKKVGDQHAVEVNGKSGSTAITAHVGEVLSVTPAGVISKCADNAAVATALGAGNLVILISQSDAVTYKTGTPYKTYKLADTVEIPASTGTNTKVVGYVVENIEDLKF